MFTKLRFLLIVLMTLGASLEAREISRPQIDAIASRWQLFQQNREFTPFAAGKSDAELTMEFKTVDMARRLIWQTPEYELARHLIDDDLIRAPGCVAFDYNNTIPYYNASNIYLNGHYYIACEGPRSKDTPKFFHLLQSYGVTHLVRLTDSYEGQVKKCHPYWDGKMSISADGQNFLNIPSAEEAYQVCAYKLSHWRDHQGIDPKELLALALQIRAELNETQGLLAVHCSAGVGRTGTFLASLAILDAVDLKKPFSIEEIVYKLSLQRIHCVAKAGQYITLHRLAEIYLQSRGQD